MTGDLCLDVQDEYNLLIMTAVYPNHKVHKTCKRIRSSFATTAIDGL